MASIPPAAVLAAAAAQPQPESDKLIKVTEKAIEVMALEAQASDLGTQLEQVDAKIKVIYGKELPDLMDEAGVDRSGIPATGNYPAMDLKLVSFFAANIAAAWPDDKREAAFKCLEEFGAGDLIKTIVEVRFPGDDHGKAMKLAEQLKKKGLEPVVKQSVPAGTLTAWLREQVERKKKLPPLDIIGGFIGREVKLKERKT